MQTRANFFAIGAALLATATSLTVWTTLTNSPSWGAQLAVAAMALVSAAMAAFPRITNYAETAGKARELGSQYGTLLGRFIDAIAVYDDPRFEGTVRTLMADFQSVKARKDQLVPYPRTLQAQRDVQKIVAAAKPLEERLKTQPAPAGRMTTSA